MKKSTKIIIIIALFLCAWVISSTSDYEDFKLENNIETIEK